MKAVALTRYLPVEDPACLQNVELEQPSPEGRDLLVQVLAVSVNPVDTKVRAPKPAVEEQPKVLGWDACGIVVDTGDDTSLFKAGDRVYYAGDITRQGSNAEYQLVDERIVALAPQSLGDAESAALPLTAITAWESLFDRLEIDLDADNSDKRLLVIGGAGGVGSIATQLAANVAGLKVIATASRPETQAWCEKMGAAHVINHHQDIEAQLSDMGIPHVDYVLCCADTDLHFDAMVGVCKPQGKICCMVDSQGRLDMNKLKAKSQHFVWEFMFTRAKFQTEDMIEQHHLLTEVARLIDEGVLVSTLTERTHPICAETIRAVHQKLEQGGAIGKTVVEGWS